MTIIQIGQKSFIKDIFQFKKKQVENWLKDRAELSIFYLSENADFHFSVSIIHRPELQLLQEIPHLWVRQYLMQLNFLLFHSLQ